MRTRFHRLDIVDENVNDLFVVVSRVVIGNNFHCMGEKDSFIPFPLVGFGGIGMFEIVVNIKLYIVYARGGIGCFGGNGYFADNDR